MKKSLLALGVSAALASTSVFATNGYAPIGVGMSAKGMGGAGIAYPQDTLAGGINPAGMVHLGNRWDAGLEIFIPDRGFTSGGVSFDGNGSGAMESWFPIPEFGYNRMLSDDLSVGISIFGNGGLNTTYNNPIANPFRTISNVPNNDSFGIDLMQVFISPTVSYKVNEQLSVGASLNLIAQSFKSTGLSLNDPSDPSSGGFPGVSDSRDYSYGASIRQIQVPSAPRSASAKTS